MATWPLRATSSTPNGRSTSSRPAILSLVPGGFEDERVRRDVDDAGAEHFRQLHHVRPRLGIGGDLDHHELAPHRGRAGDVLDADDVHQLPQVRLDAARGDVRRIDDDGHARNARRSVTPTVSDTILNARRRKSDETRVSTPGSSSTSTTNTCGPADVTKASSLPIATPVAPNFSSAFCRATKVARYRCHYPSSIAVSTSADGRRIIACRSAPAGTIG